MEYAILACETLFENCKGERKEKNKKCEKFYNGVKLCYQLKAVGMLTIKPFLILWHDCVGDI